MATKTLRSGVILVAFLCLVGCRAGEPEPVAGPDAGSEGEPAVGMANPAAVYCEGLGYATEDVVTDAGVDAACIFPDGSRCGAWDFLSGRCGQSFSYCAQNGGTLEEEGTNIGTCVFSDGSSCPEFEFFEGRCRPEGAVVGEAEEAVDGGPEEGAGGGTEEAETGEPTAGQRVIGWYGYVSSLPDTAQFDDKLVLHPEGAGEVGIAGGTELNAASRYLCTGWTTASCPSTWLGGLMPSCACRARYCTCQTRPRCCVPSAACAASCVRAGYWS